MGVNLFMYEITGKSTEALYDGREIPYYETKSVDWWDALRYSGDRDFILDNDFIAVDADLEVEEQRLFRPADFDKSIRWVHDNIQPEGNKERLLKAISKMRDNKSLCFSWSW